MKQSISLALSALFALATALPLEKRAYTSTIIQDVTETIDVYTTIYVSPGDPRLTSQQAATQTPSSAPVVSVTPSASTSAVQPSTPPQTTSQAPVIPPEQNSNAQVQAPAATSTPVPSATPQPLAQPKVEAVAPVAPAAPVVPVPPVQSSAAPIQNKSPSSGSTSNSGSSGGSCGTVGGKCTAGDVTTFEGAGAAGACGYRSPEKTPDYVALAVAMMGPQSNDGVSKNPYCDRKIRIKNLGQTYDAMITDKCPGCRGGDHSLDLSPSLFAKIFDGATTGNFHNIEWWFTS